MRTLGTLFIISAPSGGGKTSLVNALLQQMQGLTVSISHTTREPRLGEIEGKNYFFVDETTFENYQQKGIFLEHAKVFNYWYGTSKTWVLEQLKSGLDVILEIDWQGARRIKEQMECVNIFIVPPSRDILLTRLQDRRQDSEEVIEQRMAQASHEISHYSEYDYVIINDNFESALADLAAIVRSQRLTIARQKQVYEQIFASLIG